MVRRLLSLIGALLLGPILIAQTPSAPSHAEYPDFDRPLWGLLKRGFDASSAARSLARDPSSVDTFTQLADAGRPDEAVRVLERIVAGRPEDLLAAVTALQGRVSGLDDEASGRRERLRSIVAAMKAKLPSLSRDAAASFDYALIGIDSRLERTSSRERPARLRRIVDLYPSTAAAKLAEVDLLDAILPISSRVEALEAFARSHPGTLEGAKALYLAASHIAYNLPEGQARKGEEPSARFARVVSMVRELESGAWPVSERTARAPSIVTGFSAYQARHSPEGIRRMVDLYREFVASHFVIEDNPAGWSVTHVITTRLPQLLQAAGDASLVGMEPMFEEWARATGQSDAVRFARALMFQKRTAETESPDRAMWLQRARDAFDELAASGTGLYQRRRSPRWPRYTSERAISQAQLARTSGTSMPIPAPTSPGRRHCDWARVTSSSVIGQPRRPRIGPRPRRFPQIPRRACWGSRTPRVRKRHRAISPKRCGCIGRRARRGIPIMRARTCSVTN